MKNLKNGNMLNQKQAAANVGNALTGSTTALRPQTTNFLPQGKLPIGGTYV